MTTPSDAEREAELRALLADQRGPYYYGDFRDGAVLLLRLLDGARNEIARLRERAREARATAIEEAAQLARKYADNPTSGDSNNTQAAFDLGMDHRAGCQDSASAIEQAIRALADIPPQSEGGER